MVDVERSMQPRWQLLTSKAYHNLQSIGRFTTRESYKRAHSAATSQGQYIQLQRASLSPHLGIITSLLVVFGLGKNIAPLLSAKSTSLRAVERTM